MKWFRATQHALGLFEAPPSLRPSLLGSPQRLGAELLAKAKEFNHLRVLFMSDPKVEHQMDRQFWCGISSTTGVKKELSWKASFYQLIYVPTFTYGHEL